MRGGGWEKGCSCKTFGGWAGRMQRRGWEGEGGDSSRRCLCAGAGKLGGTRKNEKQSQYRRECERAVARMYGKSLVKKKEKKKHGGFLRW